MVTAASGRFGGTRSVRRPVLPRRRPRRRTARRLGTAARQGRARRSCRLPRLGRVWYRLPQGAGRAASSREPLARQPPGRGSGAGGRERAGEPGINSAPSDPAALGDCGGACKLVSWLIPVHRHFGLSFEALCLAVNILDLSRTRPCGRRLLSASGGNGACHRLQRSHSCPHSQVEVHPPSVKELLALCCDCIVLFFLEHFSRCGWRLGTDAGGGGGCRSLAAGVAGLSLADYAFTKYAPSLLAASSLGLADRLLSHRTPLDLRVSGYPEELLRDCMDQLQLLVSLNGRSLSLLLPPEVCHAPFQNWQPLAWSCRQKKKNNKKKKKK
uniref:Cyclin O n=1 Tax=Malurus cyaneus samueli TaxID=2593467 RepID=A0A8C5TCR2_9PASS